MSNFNGDEGKKPKKPKKTKKGLAKTPPEIKPHLKEKPTTNLKTAKEEYGGVEMHGGLDLLTREANVQATNI